ncbi:MAG TPA: NAD(P)H-binding protein [Polyangiaceae bacterium]|jgi:putative NADH-flavin reductase
MKLVVFGASGKCGRELVKLATARGHAVTAVVRAETEVALPAGVVLLRGDVLDEAFVSHAVGGADAVASALGMRYAHPWARRMSPDDFISRATSHVVAAMQAHGVKRLVVISAAGVGDSRPMLNLPMRALLATSNVGVAYADLERVERLLDGSGLDWQAVRPVTLSNRAATGRIARVRRYGAMASIARADVAAYMLESLEAPRLQERTPMISETRTPRESLDRSSPART